MDLSGNISPAFQSTLPVWGGTLLASTRETMELFQSTLPVRGGTPGLQATGQRHDDFNPPSPQGEGPAFNFSWSLPHLFQSTLPVRGGTSP